MAVATSDPDARPESGEPATRSRWSRGDTLVAAVLFAATLLAYLPFRADFLVNWDSVNYALGVENFDLEHHQPHPPGYVGYVVLGRAFRLLTGDTNAALTLLSTTTAALAPLLLYGLARRLTTRRGAVIAAVLFATSPLVAHYGTVALSYLPEAVAALAFAWAAHVTRTERSVRALVAASALLALAGALRQTTLVLLLPLWAWAAWAFPWRRRIQAGGVAAALVLTWLVPLLVLAGGLDRYLELSSELASLAGGETWALSLNLVGVGTNLWFVAIGLAVGLHIAVAVGAFVWWRRRRVHEPGRAPASTSWVSTTSRTDRIFAALWVLPALATFVLVHTGQVGYVLFVLPVAFLWCGAVLDRWIDRRSSAGDASPARAHLPGAALIAGLAALNVAGGVVWSTAAEARSDSFLGRTVGEVDASASDAYWGELLDAVGRYDADTTVVLSTPGREGTFRHLGYYRPDHAVYALGRNPDDEPGHLFTARHGTNDYTVAAIDDPSPTLRLPPGTETVLLADPSIIDVMVDPERRGALDLVGGERLVVVDAPLDGLLEFHDPELDDEDDDDDDDDDDAGDDDAEEDAES